MPKSRGSSLTRCTRPRDSPRWGSRPAVASLHLSLGRHGWEGWAQTVLHPRSPSAMARLMTAHLPTPVWVGLASGSARSRRPALGPRVRASRNVAQREGPGCHRQDANGPRCPPALPIGQARRGAGGDDPHARACVAPTRSPRTPRGRPLPRTERSAGAELGVSPSPPPSGKRPGRPSSPRRPGGRARSPA